MGKPGATPQVKDPVNWEALKARNKNGRSGSNGVLVITHFQRSGRIDDRILDRWPRLLHFAPLALEPPNFQMSVGGTLMKRFGLILFCLSLTSVVVNEIGRA